LALKEEAEDSPQKQKKLKKIKKRKTRLPKGYNPANPGPLPNPERWLPRCERKEFRKKANLKSGKTQGSTNVGKEQMNLFGGKGQVRNKGRGRRAE
jgi:signal recognition particle subunit SRP72